MLSILCLKRKAKAFLPLAQKKTRGGIFTFGLIMEIRRIKLFALKITLNISMVDVQYTLIVQCEIM